MDQNEDLKNGKDEGNNASAGEANKSDNNGANGNGDNNNNNANKTEDNGEKKTYTQDELNRMMTKEKNQGRNAILKELGIDPKNKDVLEKVKEFIDSQKTSDQKAIEKNNEVAAAIAEAEAKAIRAEAKVKAIELNAKPKYVDDLIDLVFAKAKSTDEIKDLISEYKTKFPEWFSQTENNNDRENAGERGTGSVFSGSKKDNGDDNKSFGARLAAQRTVKPKSSYWKSK